MDRRISILLNRYITEKKRGKRPYFDADEINDLLDGIEAENDYTYYDEILELGLSLHPDDPNLLIRKSEDYIGNGKLQQAFKMLSMHKNVDPDALDVLKLESFCSMKKFDKVKYYLNKLIKNDSEYLEAALEVLSTQLNLFKMYDEAYKTISFGLKKFPDNEYLMDELVITLETKGEFKQCLPVVNKLISKNPYSADHWYTLGRLYTSLCKYDKAIEALDFSLTCDSSIPDVNILKAFCLYMVDNHGMVISILNKIPLLDDSHLLYAQLLAQSYIHVEDYRKAYKLLKELTFKKGFAEGEQTYINFMRCCAKLGYNNKLEQIMKKAFSFFPDSMYVLTYTTLTCLLNGDKKSAVKYGKQAFELSVKQAENMEDVFNSFANAVTYLAGGDFKSFKLYFSTKMQKELLDFIEQYSLSYDKSLTYSSEYNHVDPEDLVQSYLDDSCNAN